MNQKPHITSWQPMPDGAWTCSAELPLGDLHLPAWEGRVVGPISADPIEAAFPLPWRAPFLIVQTPDIAHLLAIRGGPASFPSVTALASDQGWHITLNWRPAAWLDRAANPPVVHLAQYTTWRDAVAEQRLWMQQALPSPRIEAPGWIERCPACVMFEMWTGSGHIANDYRDAISLVQALADVGAPPDTLLYFWGFHAPFDTRYPEYWPAKELGGAEGLHRFAEEAHRHGYRLMPHCNWWGLDGRLPAYTEPAQGGFAEHQVRNRQGERAGWREPGEPPIEYIRPTHTPWRRYIQERIVRLVETFHLDAVFLDQIAAWSNDPGCNFEAGSHVYAREMADALPGVALGGEIIHERFRDLPLFQAWGTPWCGLKPEGIPGQQTEILAILFGSETHLFGHMGTPAGVDVPDSWPSYYWFPQHMGSPEAALEASVAYHRQIGAIPSVRVHPRGAGLDAHAQRVLTRSAARW
ncbi:MAG: DUF6259 domain-containing protein [Anaerolineae bacterium]